MKKSYLNLAAAALLAFAVHNSALANPVLWLVEVDALNNQIADRLITDGSVFDINSAANTVAFNGSVGSWSLNFTLGTSIGTNANPELDLSSYNYSSRASTLWVGFSDDGFGPSIGSVNASIGGTTDGSVQFWSGIGSANQSLPSAFSYPGAILDFGSLPGSNNQAFSGSTSWGLSDTNYSLVEWVKITHTSAGNTSFDAALTVPDSGTTALLLGLGLVGMGLISRRRKAA